ncbi:BatD family protein [Rhizobium sp. RCAM05350]|nr:BatD family protein [Rhizobium sp. RCAM05350]
MRRFQIAIAFWLACLSSALGADPFALATIDNQGTIVPGQQVHLTVDVFAPNFFTSPPQFPLFDLPNTIVSLSDERAQNLTQTVDDVQYSGIRRAYTIVPEMAGTFTLPEVIISFDYSDDGKTVKGTARVPATTFTVGNVPGGNGGTLPFAARGVVLTQSFDRDPAKLKAGEALVHDYCVWQGYAGHDDPRVGTRADGGIECLSQAAGDCR